MGEKNDELEQGGTVRMDPADLPAIDPGATRAEDPGATRLTDPDPDATRLAGPDASATQEATRAAATRVAARVPAVDAPAEPLRAHPADPERDGIDALSDPYFSPATLPEDLTEARPMIAIESPVESLPERKRRLPRWAVVLLVVLAAAAAAGIAYLTYENELWGGRTVPAVVGQTEEDARAELEGLGFEVAVEYRAGDENIGMVLDCSPAEGMRADPAAGITLVVGAGRTIPQVVGMAEEDATQALYDAGATDVLVKNASSDEPAGTVIAVSPEVGEPFVSGDQITLTVAQPYTVPSVEGLSADDALAALKERGLKGEVSYVESDAEKNTVVSSDPAEGTEVAGGSTVKLGVSSPYPSSPASLMEYFEATPEQLSDYLADEGFSLRYSAIYVSGGNAHAVYEGKSGDLLHITNEPETGHYAGSSEGDVLAEGAGVGGVRYAFSAKTLPSGAGQESEAGVRAVMKACGFEGLVDTCAQDDLKAPVKVSDDYHFICAYGKQGGYTWAVRIGGSGSNTGVVAMVAPTEHFSGVDLSDFGGVCDYVAYIDLFTG